MKKLITTIVTIVMLGIAPIMTAQYELHMSEMNH